MERRARTKSKLIVGKPKEKEIKRMEGRGVSREAESGGRETRRMPIGQTKRTNKGEREICRGRERMQRTEDNSSVKVDKERRTETEQESARGSD